MYLQLALLYIAVTSRDESLIIIHLFDIFGAARIFAKVRNVEKRILIH